MKIIRFPWWASPSTLLVISLLVVFYAIVFVDDEQYNIWKTPRYVTHVEAVEVGSVIVAVLLGIVVAASISGGGLVEHDGSVSVYLNAVFEVES